MPDRDVHLAVRDFRDPEGFRVVIVACTLRELLGGPHTTLLADVTCQACRRAWKGGTDA